MKEQKTSEAQLKAIENYKKGKERITLWYPKAIKTQLEKKGITAREVFEYGLKHYGIKIPQ